MSGFVYRVSIQFDNIARANGAGFKLRIPISDTAKK